MPRDLLTLTKEGSYRIRWSTRSTAWKKRTASLSCIRYAGTYLKGLGPRSIKCPEQPRKEMPRDREGETRKKNSNANARHFILDVFLVYFVFGVREYPEGGKPNYQKTP